MKQFTCFLILLCLCSITLVAQVTKPDAIYIYIENEYVLTKYSKEDTTNKKNLLAVNNKYYGVPFGASIKSTPIYFQITNDTIYLINKYLSKDCQRPDQLVIVEERVENFLEIYNCTKFSENENFIFPALGKRSFFSFLELSPILKIYNAMSMPYCTGTTYGEYDDWGVKGEWPQKDEEETLKYNFVIDNNGNLILFRIFRNKLAVYKYHKSKKVEHWRDKWELLSNQETEVESEFNLFINKSNEIHLLTTDESTVYKYQDNGKLQKVNQLPKSLAKEGTLIIDKDADAVYLAPPSNDYKKGAWRNTAINVLNNQAIPQNKE